MNPKTIRVLKALLKQGMLNRSSDYELWSDLQQPEVQDELELLKRELDFDLWGTASRCYLIPNQDNTLFLQNNMDFRRDVRANSEFRQPDLYLLNYLSIFLLNEFFKGEGTDPQVRDFIEPEEFLSLFTSHCDHILGEEKTAEEAERRDSLTFLQMARRWNALVYGEVGDKSRHTTKRGCLGMVLVKLKKEDLFVELDGKIRPTEKCRDLMPYFLRRERVQAIHAFLKGEEQDAADL